MPLIWIGKVTESATSIAGSATGQGAFAISPSPPRSAQISSARCGVMGDISWARSFIAARRVSAPALDFSKRARKGVEPGNGGVEAETLDPQRHIVNRVVHGAHQIVVACALAV